MRSASFESSATGAYLAAARENRARLHGIASDAVARQVTPKSGQVLLEASLGVARSVRPA
jgi:hypothetical protein